KLNWLATSTRPDLATVTSLLSTYQNAPTPADIDTTKYVGRYFKSTPYHGITFSNEQNPSLQAYLHLPSEEGRDPSTLLGFADSNWGPQDASQPHPDHSRQVSTIVTRSICGHLVFLSGGPIMWRSHKEKRISGSSCEAEIKATDECTKSIQWLRNAFSDISLIDDSQPTTIYNDNRGAVDWSNSTSNKNMRHVNIRENRIREAVHEFHEVQIRHISGEANPADLLTKEHKSPDIFMALRDSFMSPSLDGGCYETVPRGPPHLESKQDGD
ncbi:MAG: Ty1/Copia family ribonuclease HI, partial [Gloeomargaritales cyanobacterium]